jgi:hypothetical protein
VLRPLAYAPPRPGVAAVGMSVPSQIVKSKPAPLFAQRRSDRADTSTVAGRRKEHSGRVELGSCGDTSHGKEGVDGSSPSEGSAKAPHLAFFLSIELLPAQRAVGVELEMELSRRNVRFRHVPSARNARLDTGAYAAPMSNLNDPRQATADGIAAARVGERAGAAAPAPASTATASAPRRTARL